MSIKCGNYSFDGPYQITAWNPPFRAGVYAIMIKGDKPNTHKIIYFGESENLSVRGFVKQHHKYSSFISHAGAESNLYIGVYFMPTSTPSQRRTIESELVTQFSPDCNG